jgi:hypothetical protein
VGVAAFHALPVNRNGVVIPHPYISVIGVSQAFRGKRKGGLRPGDYVLLDVLDAISRHPQWGPQWDVFALVDPANQASVGLFERNRFVLVQEAPAGHPELDCLLALPGRDA